MKREQAQGVLKEQRDGQSGCRAGYKEWRETSWVWRARGKAEALGVVQTHNGDKCFVASTSSMVELPCLLGNGLSWHGSEDSTQQLAELIIIDARKPCPGPFYSQEPLCPSLCEGWLRTTPSPFSWEWSPSKQESRLPQGHVPFSADCLHPGTKTHAPCVKGDWLHSCTWGFQSCLEGWAWSQPLREFILS